MDDRTGDSADLSEAELFNILVTGPKIVQSYSNTYWCFAYSIQNTSTGTISYGPFDFELLTPSGALVRSSIPFGIGGYPGSGQISPTGLGTDLVCFEADSHLGRYALVYEPFLIGVDNRALAYFDR